MSVDKDDNNTRKCTVSVQDCYNEEDDEQVVTDGCYSDTSSEEDDESEEDSTQKVSEMSAAVLQHPGMPSTIHMENTSDVQIGPRLLYNAPVTINQYVHVLGNNEVSDNGLIEQAVKAPIQDSNFKTTGIPEGKLNGQAGQFISGARQYNGTTANYSNSNRLTLFLKRRILLLALGMTMLLVTVLALTIYFTSNKSHETQLQEPPKDSFPDPNRTLAGGHYIYSKENWFGKDARYASLLTHPTPFIVISDTETDQCYSETICSNLVVNIQDEHMGGIMQLPDIGYNFLIGGDGNVYEGRGWDATNMHSGFVKRCNFGISFIGNFVNDIPTDRQIKAAQELIKLGVKLGKISENYRLMPLNETKTPSVETQEPLNIGVNLYNIIKEWPHFWIPSYNDTAKCPYIA